MKFGICNDVYIDWKITDIIQHAAGLGYEGIELAPFTLTDDVEKWRVADQKEIRRCAADHGIEITGLHWLLIKPEGLHVTSPDSEVRTRTRDFFLRLIDMAVNTGGRILTLGSPKQRSFLAHDSHEAAILRLQDFLREIAPAFEDADAVLALEPLEADLTNMMSRTDETRQITDAVDSEHIGITLDTHFLRWEGEEHGIGVHKAFEQAGPRLLHMHIQDDNDGAPGSGTADFGEYIEEVKRIEWAGYISLETFPRDGLPPPEQTAEATLQFLKESFGG